MEDHDKDHGGVLNRNAQVRAPAVGGPAHGHAVARWPLTIRQPGRRAQEDVRLQLRQVVRAGFQEVSHAVDVGAPLKVGVGSLLCSASGKLRTCVVGETCMC
jgi:hypothetical protein